MPRKPKDFPLDVALHLRERGYSYEMIAYRLWHDHGIDVSKWTVMRRLKNYETQKTV